MSSSDLPNCRWSSSIDSSVKRKVQKRIHQVVETGSGGELEDENVPYCGVTKLSRDAIPLTYTPLIPFKTDRAIIDKLEWSWLMQHGHLKLNMLENIQILASPLAIGFRASSDDWFFLPIDMHPMSELYKFYVRSGLNPRYDPYEAYAHTFTTRNYLETKIVMSKRLLESFTLGCHEELTEALPVTPIDDLPFHVPSPLKLHLPIHILIYDVGRKVTARYSSTRWDDVLPRVLEDYSLPCLSDEYFVQYCFEIYHVWMKAEPSEEWLSIPIPPRPGDALVLTETVCHFDDPVGVDPLDSSSNYKLPSDCSSYKSSYDKEVYVTDQCYASRTAVQQWIQMLEPVDPETTPDAPHQSFDDASPIDLFTDPSSGGNMCFV